MVLKFLHDLVLKSLHESGLLDNLAARDGGAVVAVLVVPALVVAALVVAAIVVAARGGAAAARGGAAATRGWAAADTRCGAALINNRKI